MDRRSKTASGGWICATMCARKIILTECPECSQDRYCSLYKWKSFTLFHWLSPLLCFSVCVSVICSSEYRYFADIVPKINRLMLHRDQQEISVAVPGTGCHRREDWTTGDSSESQDTGWSSTTRQRRKFFCFFFFLFISISPRAINLS